MSRHKPVEAAQRVKKPITATKVRIILCALLFILIVAQLALLFFGQRLLSSYSQQVADVVSLSSSNAKTLQDLETVKSRLAAQQETVTNASRITAQKGSDYNYQSQVVSDLSTYANKANLQIANYTFTDNSTATATGTPAATPAGGAASTFGPPAGLSPILVNITFANGASYDAIYSFLQYIEGNLLYMQPENLTAGRSVSGDAEDANSSVSSLTIRIYKQS